MNTDISQRPSNRLLELDCLRGIAAIMVVFFHLTMTRAESKYGFNIGATGVDLFFIISGFVIFLTIERAKTYKEFVWSRFSRLFPTYWVCVTITSILIIGWKIAVKMPLTFPTVKDYLANLTMMQYLFGVLNIDGPYWTLSIELLFYVFILIVFLFKALKRIELISLLLVMLIVAIKLTSKPSYDLLNYYIPFLSYAPLFFSGILFYKVKFQDHKIIRIVLLCVYLGTQIFILGDRDRAFVSNLQYGIVILCYFIIFFLYCYNYLGFIVNRVSLFFGKISYSLYLIHQFVAVGLLLPLLTHSKYFHFNYWGTVFLFVLPVVILLGTLLNKFIEIPTNKFLRRKLIN